MRLIGSRLTSVDVHEILVGFEKSEYEAAEDSSGEVVASSTKRLRSVADRSPGSRSPRALTMDAGPAVRPFRERKLMLPSISAVPLGPGGTYGCGSSA